MIGAEHRRAATNFLLGRTGSIDIVASNTGPDAASGVFVTNYLPPNVTLGNVAVSQGSWTVNGNLLLMNFGAIGGNSYVLASFEFTTTTPGAYSFSSVAARSGTESYLGNNGSIASVNVGEPLVSVFLTTTNENAPDAVFVLQLDAPVPLPVNVAFTTASGTATAGQDFVSTNGVVTFAPFVTSASVRVTILDDQLFEDRANEPHEYFFLHLTSATSERTFC